MKTTAMSEEKTEGRLYRLVLSHPDWPRDARTKWQASQDFTTALAKAKELGVTARIETTNTPTSGHE